MSKVCDKVELNTKEIGRFLKTDSVKNIITEVAEEVAKNAGGSAEVRISYGKTRLTAFVSMDYDEASKDNRLLKAL